MSGFLFAFLAAILASLGARDQILLAGLARVQGLRPALLGVAIITVSAATALTAWVGARLLAELAPPVRALVAPLALFLAGGEMLATRAPRIPTEPTRSLFAAAMVFAAFQTIDAARLLVLGIAAATAAPLSAALGGAAGSAAMLAAGWSLPALGWPRVSAIRRTAGAILLVAAAIYIIAPKIGESDYRGDNFSGTRLSIREYCGRTDNPQNQKDCRHG